MRRPHKTRQKKMNKMREQLSILIFILLFLSTSFAAAPNVEFNGGLDTKVISVVSGGLWEKGENSGQVRIIVRNLGWEHTRSFFYIQWLRSNDSNQTVEEFATIPIPELNEGSWINSSKLERISNNQGTRFKLWYRVRGEEKDQSAILWVGDPEEYKLLQP